MSEIFTTDEAKQIEKHGLTLSEALRQLKLLRAPSPLMTLDRPCRNRDGIDPISEESREQTLEDYRRAVGSGRCSQFIPASGAASRMFQDLLRSLNAEGREAVATRRFIDNLDRFAFADDLQKALNLNRSESSQIRRAGRSREVLAGLLSPGGLDYAALPKGLLKFHAYGSDRRTAFEEHLVEGAEMAKDKSGRCRMHFTVSEAHLDLFRGKLNNVQQDYEARHGVRYEIGFSVQEASTDTLSLDAEGNPAQVAEGRLLFRPGGHGSLLGNLQSCGGDLLFVKNIDNVAIEPFKAPTYHWGSLLIGKLVETQDRVFHLLDRLEDRSDAGAPSEAAFGLRELFHRCPDAEAERDVLIDQLNRPIRICGMVPNRGEPGGGPFWVRGPGGSKSLQIVEGAHVDVDSSDQMQIFARGTHFNPVFMALALRDRHGEPHDLRRFVDTDSYLVTKKSDRGRDLFVLEHPGLWNGAMAGWLTIFVDLPIEIFTPVKAVEDLLRMEHQQP